MFDAIWTVLECSGFIRNGVRHYPFLIVEQELKLAGFWESIPARNKLKAEIQKILLAAEFATLHKSEVLESG